MVHKNKNMEVEGNKLGRGKVSVGVWGGQERVIRDGYDKNTIR